MCFRSRGCRRFLEGPHGGRVYVRKEVSRRALHRYAELYWTLSMQVPARAHAEPLTNYPPRILNFGAIDGRGAPVQLQGTA